MLLPKLMPTKQDKQEEIGQMFNVSNLSYVHDVQMLSFNKQKL